MTDRKVPAKYNVSKVEAVILERAVELHPQHMSTNGLLREILENLTDAREVETASRAIHNLREVGLFAPSDDGKVEPTTAALHAVRLLT